MCMAQHFIDSSTESALRSAIGLRALGYSHVSAICRDTGRVTTRTDSYQKILGHKHTAAEKASLPYVKRADGLYSAFCEAERRVLDVVLMTYDFLLSRNGIE